MKKKVCIIGFNYSYNVLLQSFNISKKFNVIGIAGKKSRNVTSSNSFKYYTSWKKMIIELKPEIIAVGIPPKEQEKILPYLLKNKFNFICEKPITNNIKKLNFFSKFLKKNKSIKLIDLNFITIPAIQKFKQLLKKEKLSRDTKINIDWYFKPKSINNKSSWKNSKKNIGGELNNFFFHLISVIYFLFGNFKINTIYKKNYHYNFLFKSRKISFTVNFFCKNKFNLFKIKFQNKSKLYSLINKSKDYHNNFYIYKNKKKIFKKNFPNSKGRIFASKNILDIFLNKNKDLKKYLVFERGLDYQKKIINLL